MTPTFLCLFAGARMPIVANDEVSSSLSASMQKKIRTPHDTLFLLTMLWLLPKVRHLRRAGIEAYIFRCVEISNFCRLLAVFQ